MILSRMTRPEIMDLDKNMVVVIPLGSTEQHSLHLPVDTDTRLVEAVCRKAEETETDKLLLLPTVWMGHSPHHLKFGGTISLNYDVYAAMLEDVIRSITSMGFRKILLVNGHGGNNMPVSIVQQEIKLEDPQLMLCAACYWELAREEILKNRKGGSHSMGHACELETSLYLYLNEEGVRKDKIRNAGRTDDSGYLGIGMFNGGPLSYLANFDEFTDTGGFGEAETASKEEGKQIFDAVTTALSGLIEVLYRKDGFYQKD